MSTHKYLRVCYEIKKNSEILELTFIIKMTIRKSRGLTSKKKKFDIGKMCCMNAKNDEIINKYKLSGNTPISTAVISKIKGKNGYRMAIQEGMIHT